MYNAIMQKDTTPSILNVARKIVELTNTELTPLKLQKLAYYCQAWSLAWKELPMFNEDFQAWANGPVNTELYSKHRGQFVIGKDFLSEYSNFEFSEDDMITIKKIIAHYGGKDPFYLSELTHKERPWREARGNAPMGAICDNVISKESIQDYYAGIATA